MNRLLLVEDDELVQSLLAAYLEKEGYDVAIAATGAEMQAFLDLGRFDLILLDLNLPDEDGLALARQVRSRSAVPIIVLTARAEIDDRLAALEIGADDYLTKPFDPRELVLRLRNMLGRAGEGGQVPAASRVVSIGEWILDLDSRALTDPSGREVALTPSEFRLLAALGRAQNRVLSRDHLLDAIALDGEAPSPRTIDVLVSRLRRKIEKDHNNPKVILTVPGFGYKLARQT